MVFEHVRFEDTAPADSCCTIFATRIPYIALACYLAFGAYTYFFSGGAPKGKEISLEEAVSPGNPRVFFDMQVLPPPQISAGPTPSATICDGSTSNLKRIDACVLSFVLSLGSRSEERTLGESKWNYLPPCAPRRQKTFGASALEKKAPAR